MTTAVPRTAPQRTTAVLGVALGAVSAAVLGAHGGDVTLSDARATTADLHLLAGHRAAPAVTAAPVEATSAAATVPELVKGHHRQEIEDAVARFESRIGTTRYEGYCERAVENAFGTQHHYASAIQDWRSQEQHRDWRHAPRGAMVFYDTSSNGHVALSLGDGRVVSSSAHGRVGIVPIDHFRRPLGWAYAPY